MGHARLEALRDSNRLAAMALAGVELLLVGLLALGLVRLAYALLVPQTPLGSWQAPPLPPAVEPAVLARFDPFFRSRGAGDELIVSELDLQLMGTRLDQATGRGSAIIRLGEDRQESFAVGDEIQPGVRLVAVAFDAVTLDNGGLREQLFLDQSGPVPEATMRAGTGAADAPIVPARLGADLMAVPRMEGARLTGLVLSPRGSGTGFAAAGLKPGDVLLRVDGQEVGQLGDPAALVRRLDSGGATLEIERGGQRVRVQLGAGGVAG